MEKKRIYKIKNPTLKFFCPLCRVERGLKTLSRLSALNYIQIIIISLSLFALSYPYWGEKAFFWPIIVWSTFEFVKKLFYRKEIPCPECGFDATWYKRDVKIARRLVHEFWSNTDKKDISGQLNLAKHSQAQTQEDRENA